MRDLVGEKLQRFETESWRERDANGLGWVDGRETAVYLPHCSGWLAGRSPQNYSDCFHLLTASDVRSTEIYHGIPPAVLTINTCTIKRNLLKLQLAEILYATR